MNMDAYLQHADWVRSLALELVRDASAADDLAQEAWLAFVKAKPDTDRPLRPWLGRVLRNAAALRQRGGGNRENRERLVARRESDGEDSAEDVVLRAEQQRHIAGKVLALPEPYRSTLLLRYYDGLTPEQIAKKRGVPGATVRTHLRRGLERLRLELVEEHDGDVRAWLAAVMPVAWGVEAVPVGVGLGGVAVGLGAVLALVLGAIYLWPSRFPLGAGEQAALLDSARGSSLEAGVGLVEGGANGVREQADFAQVPQQIRWRLVDPRGVSLPGLRLVVDGAVRHANDRGEIVLPALIGQVAWTLGGGEATDELSGHYLRKVQTVGRQTLSVPTSEASGEGPSILEIPVGPAMELHLPNAPQGIALQARLGSVGLTEMRDDGLLCQIAPVVSEGGSHRVRFAGLPGGMGRAGVRWRLEVRDLEGTWWGEVQFLDWEDAPSGGYTVPMEATCVLEGRADFGGGPWDHGVLYATAAGENPTGWYQAGIGAQGNFRMGWILPGSIDLSLHSKTHKPFSKSIQLRPGELRRIELELTPTVLAGPLTGTLRSQSGRYGGGALIMVADGEGQVFEVFPLVWEVAEGSEEKVAHFEFERVPRGLLQVFALPLQDRVGTKGAGQPIDPADGPVEMWILDKEPTTDWLVDVRHGETLEPLLDWTLKFEPAGELARSFVASEEDGRMWWLQVAGNMQWNRIEGDTPLAGLPLAARFSWRVKGPGFVGQEGDEGSFEVQADGRRRLQVFLGVR